MSVNTPGGSRQSAPAPLRPLTGSRPGGSTAQAVRPVVRAVPQPEPAPEMSRAGRPVVAGGASAPAPGTDPFGFERLALGPSVMLALRGMTFRLKQTLLSMAGVIIGVVALTTILSVANGFEQSLINNILETSGHIQIFSSQDHEISHPEDIARTVAKIPGVIGVAPAIMVQGMVEYAQTFCGCNIKAVDPVRELQINSIGTHIVDGRFAFTGPNDIILGKDMARQLGAHVGSKVGLTIPGGKKFQLNVVGIFKTGVSDFDFQIVLVPIPFCQKNFDFGDSVSHLFVRCADPTQARSIALQIRKDIAYDAMSWLDTNRLLLEAIALERRVMFVVIFLTLVVAAFGMSNVLTMVVLEKYRDIGIMRALGMRTQQILRIFLLQGFFIGVAGAVLGCLGGVGLGCLLRTVPIKLPTEIYYVDRVPVLFNLRDFGAIAILACTVALLASYFPARKAMAIQPVEAIRYYA